jgi:DNA-binding PadR family transcriptional regulator
MKTWLDQLDKALDNRIRLAATTLLMTETEMDFVTLKATLEVTDGNLSSHLAALEKVGYLAVEKQFRGRKPQTTYRLTPTGRAAYMQHLAALEQLLRQTQQLPASLPNNPTKPKPPKQ